MEPSSQARRALASHPQLSLPWHRLLTHRSLLWRLLVETYEEWSNDKAPRMGAALAYYTIFSLAPVLLVATAAISLFVDTHTAHRALVEGLQTFLGRRNALIVEEVISTTISAKSGVSVTALAALLSILGSTMVFAEMRDALNTIWEVRPRRESTLIEFIRTRLSGLATVLGIGVLLFASVLISTAISIFASFSRDYLPMPAILIRLVDFAASLVILTVLFAMLYRILPAAKIAWRNVWIGAVITSFLFTIGKMIIGLYLGHSALTSEYGAAGSLIAVAVWTYYSAQTFYFGAEMTHVYTTHCGSLIQPEDNAEHVPKSAGGNRI